MTDNQMTLPNGKVITFNEQQVEAIQKIRKWLKDKTKTFFTLAGYAGTGKTSIIKKILDEYRGGIVVSAPTHKAVKMIKNTTEMDGLTLHSLLGLRPDLDLADFNPNNPQFNPIVVPKINDYNFVVIDEASMINRELFELIKEKTENTRTKVLFMGDSAQLPPVTEEFSIVFTDEEIEKHELTIIERQENDNPLLPIYDALRNNLENDSGGYLRKTDISNSGKGVEFILNKIEFRKKVIERFNSEEFKNDSDYCKGLAWKNDTVMASNRVVRNEIFGNEANIVEIGDILMGYRTITSSNQSYNIIENSADYHIIKKSKLIENELGIKGFRVKLREDLARKQFKFIDVFVIDSDDHDNLHLYAEMHDYLRDIAKQNKKKWKEYYEFRRTNLLMKTIDKHKDGVLRSSSDIITKDMDYGYFITVHKSQGSTYQHIMVMENDLNLNWNVVERNKLRYVALTRPQISATVLTTKLD